jgi:hypothetical protein
MESYIYRYLKIITLLYIYIHLYATLNILLFILVNTHAYYLLKLGSRPFKLSNKTNIGSLTRQIIKNNHGILVTELM